MEDVTSRGSDGPTHAPIDPDPPPFDVLDMFLPRVFGWEMPETMPQELTIAALKMAVTQCRPIPGSGHYFDLGSNMSHMTINDSWTKM